MPTARRRLQGPWLLGTIAIASVGASCATPQPIVRLKPATGPVVWVAGRQVLSSEKDGVQVAIAFERQDSGMLGLRVEVQNGTSAPVLVDPATISFAACSDETSASCRPSQTVIDPEHQLALLERRQSVAAADAANEQAAMGTLVILSAIGGAGRAGRGPGAFASTLSAASYAEASAARNESHQATLAAQQAVWSDVVLRKTTIFPGQGAGGRVFIPIRSEARFVWLQVGVGNRNFPFHFARTVALITQDATWAEVR